MALLQLINFRSGFCFLNNSFFARFRNWATRCVFGSTIRVTRGSPLPGLENFRISPCQPPYMNFPSNLPRQLAYSSSSLMEFGKSIYGLVCAPFPYPLMAVISLIPPPPTFSFNDCGDVYFLFTLICVQSGFSSIPPYFFFVTPNQLFFWRFSSPLQD